MKKWFTVIVVGGAAALYWMLPRDERRNDIPNYSKVVTSDGEGGDDTVVHPSHEIITRNTCFQ